jgi:hypothetical protein
LIKLQFNSDGKVVNDQSSNRKLISPAGHILDSLKFPPSKIVASTSTQVFFNAGEGKDMKLRVVDSKGTCSNLKGEWHAEQSIS